MSDYTDDSPTPVPSFVFVLCREGRRGGGAIYTIRQFTSIEKAHKYILWDCEYPVCDIASESFYWQPSCEPDEHIFEIVRLCEEKLKEHKVIWTTCDGPFVRYQVITRDSDKLDGFSLNEPGDYFLEEDYEGEPMAEQIANAYAKEHEAKNR